MNSMAATPLVSFLVPVYNRESLIRTCIESACLQTMEDFEIVVVDNASTDGTFEVCRELAAQDPRIRVFRNETNLGPVRNWRRCIEEARGEYGKILFSDDMVVSDYLTKTLPFLGDERVGFVFSSAFVGPVPFQGEVMYRYAGESGTSPSALFISMALFNGDVPLSPGGALFRLRDLRDNLLLEIPSPTVTDFDRHGGGPDLLIYLLTAAKYPQVAYLKEPLSYFRAHEGSITVSKDKCQLNGCYRQARLWFAERYLDRKWLKRLYAYEWKRECKESGEWVAPRSMVARYRNERLDLSPIDLAAALLTAKSVKKGKLVLKRGGDFGREGK